MKYRIGGLNPFFSDWIESFFLRRIEDWIESGFKVKDCGLESLQKNCVEKHRVIVTLCHDSIEKIRSPLTIVTYYRDILGFCVPIARG